MRRILLVLTMLLPLGCHIDLNDPGTEAPADQFDFPAALLLDPGGRYLYVSNNDADLSYSGGTVMMVDLPRFQCAFDAYHGKAVDADACPNAAADVATCVDDPLDPSVTDCDEAPFILADQTVKVGTFAGNLRMLDYGTGQRRLFVAVRGDPSITYVDAFPGGDGPGGRKLDCFDAGAPPAATGHPPACTQTHQLQLYACSGKPSCMMGDGTFAPGVQLLPTEPFGMAIDRGKRADGTDYARLLVSHLEGGQVSVIDAGATPDVVPSIGYISNAFFPGDSELPTPRHGAFALAPQHPGHGSDTHWFMTSNLQPLLATFTVSDQELVVPSVMFSIASQFNAGSDLRSLLFQPDGNRMFVTENAPPSVLVFDTSLQTGPNQPNQVQATLNDVIDVCNEPSSMEMDPIEVEGPAGTPPHTLLRLFVACFQSDQLMVVDPDRPGVDDTIQTGRGPNGLAFATLPGSPPRAYVANFSEDTVGVIDLQPGSPTENRMVARIGLPVPPMISNPVF